MRRPGTRRRLLVAWVCMLVAVVLALALAWAATAVTDVGHGRAPVLLEDVR